MKATGLFKVALLAGLGVGGLAVAKDDSKQRTVTQAEERPSYDTKRTTQRGEMPPEGSMREVTATVKGVDRKNHKITVELQVSPEANFMSDGKPIKIDQVKEGDKVSAWIDPASGDVMKMEVTKKGTGGMQQR
jgi:hypothetical protein